MWTLLSRKKLELPSREEALPGRQAKMPVAKAHFVNGHPLEPPFPDGLEQRCSAMGCFWGAERKFWRSRRLHHGGRLCRRLYAEPDL